MTGKMLYLHALTPVHTGTGQSVDVVDLPVAREETTGWPYIPGSSIKGVLRDVCKPANAQMPAKDSDDWHDFYKAFGPDTERADAMAGALVFTDAQLLCLPVRSLVGTFAWVTCPLAMARLKRDYAGIHATLAAALPDALALSTAEVVVSSASQITWKGPGDSAPKVVLEDLDLTVVAEPEWTQAVDAVAEAIGNAVFGEDAQWLDVLKQRIAVVSNDMFGFLCETATQVTARIKIQDERKTVQRGGLWYEEAVPAEAIFVSPVLAMPRNGTSAEQLFKVLAPAIDSVVQVGGNASVGRGLMRVRLVGGTS